MALPRISLLNQDMGTTMSSNFPAELVYVLLYSEWFELIWTESLSHGPMFLGTAFNILFYGISITQTYLYLINYKTLVFQPHIDFPCISSKANQCTQRQVVHQVLCKEMELWLQPSNLNARRSTFYFLQTQPTPSSYLFTCTSLWSGILVGILSMTERKYDGINMHNRKSRLSAESRLGFCNRFVSLSTLTSINSAILYRACVDSTLMTF